MLKIHSLVLLALLTSTAVDPQEPPAPRPVAPVHGSLVLASGGKLPDCVLESFLQLSGGATGEIILLSGSQPAPKTKRWQKLGATSVESLRLEDGEQLREDEVMLKLLAADGLWIEDIAEELLGDPLFHSVVANIQQRGGAIGGTGVGALALVSVYIDRGEELKRGGLDLLPSSVLHLEHRGANDGLLGEALAELPGHIGWGIPKATALVVHHGRKVGAMGGGAVTAIIAANGEWPERLERIEAVDVVDHGDLAPYRLDLLAWRRAAQQRTRPVFPPERALVPEVKRGTLILHGGGGVSDQTFERFIKEAGGKKALIVCIPSAAEVDEGDEPDSFSEDELRARGCENLFVLHTTRPEVADGDEAFLAPLAKADGVWIDGGRTYRVMDSFQHTKAHQLMFDVLERGGVVAGSSAGGQVLGDFLVRGNPRTNRDLVFEGYTTGFGLLRGVIIDAHFRQRDRGAPFEELLQDYPQMLGIGIDADTALVVQGTTGEVLGEELVSFYDFTNKKRSARIVELKDGESYDLKKRKRGK